MKTKPDLYPVVCLLQACVENGVFESFPSYLRVHLRSWFAFPRRNVLFLNVQYVRRNRITSLFTSSIYFMKQKPFRKPVYVKIMWKTSPNCSFKEHA